VRNLVGYDRPEWPALAALERIHDLAGGYIGFLLARIGAGLIRGRVHELFPGC